MIDKKQRKTGLIAGDFNKRPMVGFDPSRYKKYLNDTKLSEGQKQDLLEALWGILSNLVELGFGVHPVQKAMTDKGHCGQSQIDESMITATLLDYPNANIGGQL